MPGSPSRLNSPVLDSETTNPPATFDFSPEADGVIIEKADEEGPFSHVFLNKGALTDSYDDAVALHETFSAHVAPGPGTITVRSDLPGLSRPDDCNIIQAQCKP